MQSKKWLRARTILVSILVGTSGLRAAAQEPAASQTNKLRPITYLAPTKGNYLKLADEMETTLRRDVLGVWFPRTVDNDNGGFYSNFTRERSEEHTSELQSPCNLVCR